MIKQISYDLLKKCLDEIGIRTVPDDDGTLLTLFRADERYGHDMVIRYIVRGRGCILWDRCRAALCRKRGAGRCKDTDYEEFRIIDAAKLYEYVQMDDLYFRMSGGGITFGGGEPLCHPAFITAFHELYKDDGWNLRVETSLNVSEQSVKAVTPFIHEFIVDIKDMNPEIYRNYTGMDNSFVVRNLRYLVEQGATDKVLVRIPSIEGFNTEDDIQKSKEELLRMGLHRFDFFTYETSLKAAYSKTVSGKSICHYLKSLRQAAADQNGIDYEPAECHYEGECSGTCPKCEEELKILTEQLKRVSTTRTSRPRCGE